MNILVVSSFLPYPLYSGGHVRLYNLLKELSKRHTLSLVCEKRSNQSGEDIDELKKLCKEVYTFERKKQWSFTNIVKTGFSPFPFLLVGHSQKGMQQQIEKLLRENTYDLIHVETFYVFQNVPETSTPIVLAEHNIEYFVYERYRKATKSFLAPLLKIDIQKLRYFEESFWKKADRLVAVSEADKVVMNRPDATVVPNGVDLQNFKYQISNIKYQKKEKRILFVGDFKWIQNRDAVSYIILHIWPEIKSKILPRGKAGKNQKSKIKLWIVGKSIPDAIKELSKDPDVQFDETVEDTIKLFQDAFLLLAPIRVGGGTSFKILEAMASGVAVVTTPLGVEGIAAENEKEVLLGEDTDTLADSVIKLIENKSQYEAITKNARALIEEKYDWKKIVQSLEKVYESVVKTNL